MENVEASHTIGYAYGPVSTIAYTSHQRLYAQIKLSITIAECGRHQDSSELGQCLCLIDLM